MPRHVLERRAKFLSGLETLSRLLRQSFQYDVTHFARDFRVHIARMLRRRIHVRQHDFKLPLPSNGTCLSAFRKHNAQRVNVARASSACLHLFRRDIAKRAYHCSHRGELWIADRFRKAEPAQPHDSSVVITRLAAVRPR